MTAIPIDRAVVEQALDVFERGRFANKDVDELEALCDVLRAALEQPQVEQEPAIYPEEAFDLGLEAIPYYTHPQPKREPLTDSVKDAFFEGFTSVETYNDTRLNSVEEAWAEYKAAHGIGGEA